MYWMRFILVCLFLSESGLATSLILSKDKINIVGFVTSWCPPCQKTSDFLIKFANQNRQVSVQLIFVDEKVPLLFKNPTNVLLSTISQKDAMNYGFTNTIPYILIFDKDSKLIKKYHSFNETLFLKLLHNLQNGLYENGTLPPDKRVNLWQNKRY